MADRVPVEILYQVAVYFAINPFYDPWELAKQMTKQILKCCLVSRKFYQAFNPILQRTFLDDGDLGRRRGLLSRYAEKPEDLDNIRIAILSSDPKSPFARVIESRSAIDVPNMAASDQMLRDNRDDVNATTRRTTTMLSDGAELAPLLAQMRNLETLALWSGKELERSFTDILQLFSALHTARLLPHLSAD